MNLKDLYEESKGIVHKCRKDYHLHLWEKEDWDIRIRELPLIPICWKSLRDWYRDRNRIQIWA